MLSGSAKGSDSNGAAQANNLNGSFGGIGGSVSASQLDISTGTQQQPSKSPFVTKIRPRHFYHLDTVLRVIIDNMLYPVSLDVLHSVRF